MDNLTPGRCLPRSRPAFDSRASSTLRHCPAHRLSVLILLSLSGMLSEPIEAADSCRRGATEIDTAVRVRCTLQDNDTLLVSPGGSIKVTSGPAVNASDAAPGDIINQGQITGPVGIVMDASNGRGKLFNAGTIRGESNALRISGSRVAGQVSNSGTLRIAGDELADAVVKLNAAVLEKGFSNSGVVDARQAGTAVSISKTSIIGNLDNSGSIRSSGNGIAIDNSLILGSLRNSGLMSGGGTLSLESARITGDLVNSGQMLGSGSLTATVIGGRIINTGTLKDDVLSLDLLASTVQGGVYNSGSWYTGLGLWISSSQLKRFENTGSIGVGTDALRFSDTIVDQDWVNRGSIVSSPDGYAGFLLFGGSVGGNLINTGRVVGTTGIELNGASVGGYINNSGRVTGLANGMQLSSVALKGDFTNSGQIVATDNALTVTDSQIGGRWLNTGYIGVDTKADPAEVDSGGAAVAFSGSTLQGRATNRGTLQGSAIGLSIRDSQFVDGLVNAGTLQGSRYSLFVDEDSRLNNLYIAGKNTAHFEGTVYAPATTATVYSDASYRFNAGDTWRLKSLVNQGNLVVGARTVNAGGAVRIIGDYRQSSSGVLGIEVRDADRYGRMIVSGTATLPSHAKIDVDVTQPRQPINSSSLKSVLSASTLVSDGTFAVSSNSTLFNFGARKVDDHVDLLLTAKNSGAVVSAAREAGLSSSAQSAARVLDQQLALGSASSLTPFFVSATDSRQVANTLAQTLPMDNAPLRASQATLASINQAVRGRLDTVTGLSIGSLDGSSTGAGGLWSQPFSYRTGAAGTTVEGALGTVIGFDVRTSAQRRSGWAFAYADGNTGTEQPGTQQSSRLDLWQFLGYSSYTLAPDTEWMLYGGAGRNNVAGDRSLAISGVSGSAKGEYDSMVATLGTSLAHALQLNESTRLIPSLRLDYNHIRDGAYREHGPSDLAPLLLSVDKRDTDQLIAGFDTQLEKSFSPATRLSVSLGVGYDLINRPSSTTAAFAGAADQPFEITGEPTSPWLMRGGVAVATQFGNGVEVSLNYDAQKRMDFVDQIGSVRASWAF